jgi:tetratricopeptide (TPR) repeat protein
VGQDALWQTQDDAGWRALGTGKYAEAEKQFNAAMATARRFRAPDIRYAMSAAGCGNVYHLQGRLVAAERFYEHAMATAEKAVGATDRGVAAILDKLAAVCHAQLEYGKAEPLFRRALEIRETTLSSRHPLTLASMTALGSHLADRGLFDQAHPFFVRAETGYRGLLGDAHPLTASALCNLAHLYQRQGAFKEADDYFHQSLAVWDASPRPKHADMAICLQGLGLLYAAQGKGEQAEPLLQRALAIREGESGADHAEVAETLHVLAQLRRAQENSAEAESLFQRSLAVYEKTLGEKAPKLAYISQDYADMLEEEDRAQEAHSLRVRYALPLYYRSLDSFTAGHGAAGDDAAEFLKLAGWSHPKSAYAALIGYFGYGYAGRPSEARALLEEAIRYLDRNTWPFPVLLYLNRELPGDRLLAMATDNIRQMVVQTFFGIMLSQRGQQEAALAHLEWVQKNADPQYREYGMAIACIDRIRLSKQEPR